MDKPRVKPLVWVRCEGETAFVAHTSVKTYRLKWVPEFHLWTLNDRPHENVNIAKAAAQADYEARILAALEPVTVQEAARVLLDAMSDITAKPLAEMSDAMKIEAHPAILLRGLCAALRALAQKDAE